MASRGTQEIQLFLQAMDVDKLSKGSFLQNFERFGDYLRVRRGFGQICEFDTTFGFEDVTYEAHCGSYCMRTDFGHDQIISIFRVKVFTGNLFGGNLSADIGQYGSFYLLTIFDVTCDELWEEILCQRTADDQATDIEKRHGIYETNRTQGFENYIRASSDDAFYFEELNDTLFFGNEHVGTYAYIPTQFNGTRYMQIDSVNYNNWAKGYSESALIEKISATNGAFADAFIYLNQSEFPQAVDVCALQGRMIYAQGRTLYFSDIGRPGSIMADNFLIVPSQNEITCITALNGNVIIFTHTETLIYQPNIGAIVSGGRVTKISNSIGCLSPNSIVNIENDTVFVNSLGVFKTSDGVQLQDLTDGIRSFFQQYISNPLTSFFQQNGYSSLVEEQPSIEHRLKENKISCAYDKVRRHLIIGVPEQNIALVHNGVGWMIWNFTSVAEVKGTVKATSNIDNPWFISSETDLFLVGHNASITIEDESSAGLAAENRTIDSFYILQYGTGGAIDRSVGDDTEDRRKISGKFYNTRRVNYTTPSGSMGCYIEPWIKLETSFQFPFLGSTQQATNATYLLPINIAVEDLPSQPNRIDVEFRFDSTNWQPIFRTGASTELNFILPSERIESVAGYLTGSAQSGTAGVQCWSGQTATQNGNEVRIHWSGSSATGPYRPNMNINNAQKSPLIYIPMKYTGVTSQNVMNMGISGTVARVRSLTPSAVETYNKTLQWFCWQQAQFNSRSISDEHAQPVDWVFKSNQIGIKGEQQIKARSVYLNAETHGRGSTQTVGDGSVFCQINTLIGSDWKDWTSQIVDYASGSYTGSLQEIADISPLRTRFRDDSGALANRIFNLSASWGNINNSASGNFLIDDPEVNTIATSDSTKGEFLSYMFFGHMKNRAELIAIDSIKADIRPVGGRRRRGR